jgi:hypothetical protein
MKRLDRAAEPQSGLQPAIADMAPGGATIELFDADLRIYK